MKRLLALTIAAALVTSSLAVLAQTRPNFAGKWTLVPDSYAAAAAGGPGRGVGGLGSSFTATQDDKTLTVVSTTQMGEIKWDGARFIVMSTINFLGNTTETTQVWSLNASGTLNVEQTSNFGGRPETTKGRYKKS